MLLRKRERGREREKESGREGKWETTKMSNGTRHVRRPDIYS